MSSLTETIKKIKPSICPISFAQPTQKPGEVNLNIVGSGFIVSEKGYICTCAHVVNGKQGQLQIGLPQGDNFTFVIGNLAVIDLERDFALIKIQNWPPPIHVKALLLGDSSHSEEGQEIAFTGFPFGGSSGGGFAASTTKGIISAIRPKMTGSLVSFNFQLDVMTMEGNSGAPLISIETGEVLGIINARFDPLMQGNIPQITVGGRPLGFSTNIGFAIPINAVKEIILSSVKD